jgi:cobalamin biosynthesis protein CbiG
LADNLITALATIDRRAAESGFQGAANILRVPTVTFTSAELAAVEVPNPAARTFAALATPSIAEAAALLACVRMYGTGRLAITKTVAGNVTIAAAGSRR